MSESHTRAKPRGGRHGILFSVGVFSFLILFALAIVGLLVADAAYIDAASVAEVLVDELSARLEQHREIYGTLVSKDLAEFNAIARAHGLAGISLPRQD